MDSVTLWFILGAALLLAEMFTASFVICFFGLGAWGAALTAAVAPGLTHELLAFVIISPVSLFLLRRKMVATFQGRSSSAQHNRPDFPHAGRQAEVLRAISPTSEGEIALGGSFWRATADTEIPAGKIVRVIAPAEDDALLIKVEPLFTTPNSREVTHD